MCLMHEIIHEYLAQIGHSLYVAVWEARNDKERKAEAALKLEQYIIENFETVILKQINERGFNEGYRKEYVYKDTPRTNGVTSTERYDWDL